MPQVGTGQRVLRNIEAYSTKINSSEERDKQVSFARLKGGYVLSLLLYAVHLLAIQVAIHAARHLQDSAVRLLTCT